MCSLLLLCSLQATDFISPLFLSFCVLIQTDLHGVFTTFVFPVLSNYTTSAGVHTTTPFDKQCDKSIPAATKAEIGHVIIGHTCVVWIMLAHQEDTIRTRVCMDKEKE